MSRHERLILFGGGGHAAVVAETARAAGWQILGCFCEKRDSFNLEKISLRRLGEINQFEETAAEFDISLAVHPAIGDSTLRKRWLNRLPGYARPAIIHPSAIISPSAEIGDGVYVGPHAIINARAKIERGVIVNSGAIIEHDVTLGAFCHVAPGAALAGSVTIGPRALVGIGAAVVPGKTIGEDAILGAGATVVTDIAARMVAVGTPARVNCCKDV